jgi:hypothetical protein
MATGAELFTLFEDLSDSQYTIYNTDTRASRLLSMAHRNVVDRLLQQSGSSTDNLKSLQHLYRNDVAVVPTSNVVSLDSFTNSLDYLITLKAKFTDGGIVYDYECMPFLGMKNSQLSNATVRYPKYEIKATQYVILYNTGTVTISGTAVTGTGGASFTSAMIGSYFYVGAVSYGLITAVGGATALTVTTASGNVASASAYVIYSSIPTGTMKIYPTNKTCQLVTADYYCVPQDIDVSDGLDLNIDSNMLDMIAREAVMVAAAEMRDPALYGFASNETKRE